MNTHIERVFEDCEERRGINTADARKEYDAMKARILELETRMENVIANLLDLRNRPGDMMILGTALSIAEHYKARHT